MDIKRTNVQESPRNHYISYAVSILLTLLAFLAVANPSLDKTFKIVFIVGMACIQVLFQFIYWMHMKEKGHIYAALGIIMGAIIALCCVVAAVFWMWW